MKKMANLLLRLSLLFHLLHSFILFLLPAAADDTASPSPEDDDTKKSQIKNPKNKRACDDLRQVFDAFDGDKDGLITLAELSVSLLRMGISISDADLAELIESANSNGDGCVDAREFKELYRTLAAAREGDGKHMEEAFGVFDRDGDGFISEEELKRALEAIGGGHGRSLQECRRMIERADEDGDGRVSFFEFQAIMKDVAL